MPDEGTAFFSPEAVVMLPLAILVDLIGIILVFFALDDFWITDIVAITFIGGWSYFHSMIRGKPPAAEMPALGRKQGFGGKSGFGLSRFPSGKRGLERLQTGKWESYKKVTIPKEGEKSVPSERVADSAWVRVKGSPQTEKATKEATEKMDRAMEGDEKAQQAIFTPEGKPLFAPGGRKKGIAKSAKWAKRLKWLKPLCIVGEFIPYIGCLPLWTIFVYSELKSS